MTDYEKLVKALRCKRDDCEGCDLAFFDKDEGWMCQYAAKDDDAADAIEALNHLVDLNTERCEGLRKQLREAQENYEKHLNELEAQLTSAAAAIEDLQAQLPKRGEWLNVTDSYHWYGKCSVCGKEFVVNAYYADGMNYCPNCGARMEVQDETKI
jgi:DNA-directed RNA polymerase subunit RPC12/RpoP